MTDKEQRVRIVTDTTAVLPLEYLQSHPVEVIPQVILFGEDSFLEDLDISFEEFIEKLKTSADLPKTAAPPIQSAEEAFRKQLKYAHTVLAIHPSTEISGTVRSATIAKEQSFPNEDIRILDTRQIGANLATMVKLAETWAEEGRHADEIMDQLEDMIPRGRVYFLVDTLEYLQRGGRIGAASALLGTALQIKPILSMEEGRITAFEKVRTHNKAYERLKEIAQEKIKDPDSAYLSVGHADRLEDARRLAAELKVIFSIDEVPVYNMGASITTHAGPGVLKIAFFTDLL
ncbi:MAG: DegV family protein [Anaerolineales bacterium]|nr:DegV family protein [Anaerolineales bacterium]